MDSGAPLEPAFADQIGADQMSHIIGLLRSFCSYVVVDTPAYFNDVVLSLIEVSDVQGELDTGHGDLLRCRFTLVDVITVPVTLANVNMSRWSHWRVPWQGTSRRSPS